MSGYKSTVFSECGRFRVTHGINAKEGKFIYVYGVHWETVNDDLALADDLKNWQSLFGYSDKHKVLFNKLRVPKVLESLNISNDDLSISGTTYWQCRNQLEMFFRRNDINFKNKWKEQ